MSPTLLRKLLIPPLLTLLALLLEGSFLRMALPQFLVPNLVLTLVVFVGFNEVSALGAALAFIVGVESDLCSGVLIGPEAAAYSVVFGLLATLSARLFVESSFAIACAVFGASIIGNIVFLGLMFQFSAQFTSSFPQMLLEASVTAICAPLLFPLYRKLFLARRERQGSRMSKTNFITARRT